MHPNTVARLALVAHTVATHPLLRDLLLGGRLTARHAQAAADELLAVGDDTLASAVLTRTLTSAGRLGWTGTPGELRRDLARTALALDPEGAAARRAPQTAARTGVRLRAGTDGLADWTATGPALQLTAADQILTALAASDDPDDPRSRGQRQLDALLGALLSRADSTGLPLQLDLQIPVHTTQAVPVPNTGLTEPVTVQLDLTPALLAQLTHTPAPQQTDRTDPADPNQPDEPDERVKPNGQDGDDGSDGLAGANTKDPDAASFAAGDEPVDLESVPPDPQQSQDEPEPQQPCPAEPLPSPGRTPAATVQNAVADAAPTETGRALLLSQLHATTQRAAERQQREQRRWTPPPSAAAPPAPAERRPTPAPAPAPSGPPTPPAPTTPPAAPAQAAVPAPTPSPAGPPPAPAPTAAAAAVSSTPALAEPQPETQRVTPRQGVPELLGYGPLDPALISKLLTDPHGLPVGLGRVIVRRVLTDRTGTPVAVEPCGHPLAALLRRSPSPQQLLQTLTTDLPAPPRTVDRHDPSAAQTRTVHARDHTCSFPGCTRTARRTDLDHRKRYPDGPTSIANLHPLCRHHHNLKHDGWHATRTPDGTTTWTSPRGQTKTKINV